MIAAAIILAILVAGGALIYLLDRGGRRRQPQTADTEADNATPADADNDSGCCGMHLTCEKDSLSTAVSTEIEYYDDEELDIYANRSGEDYTGEETEQFRDILLTLIPSDIAGWARSLQLRHIPLPPEVSDELLLIVREAREAAVAPH
ncbi:MAG: phospholipase [Barnesiella sp.]|nr:phospholipase [Barnesiella sp.]MBD5247719.1 phospholipase [Barnesiella sp.]MBD5258703.1 phospholipase [Barnesiella sp.]